MRISISKIILAPLFCFIIISCKNHQIESNAQYDNDSGYLDGPVTIPPDTMHYQNMYLFTDSLNDYAYALATKYPHNQDSLNKSLLYLNKALKTDKTFMLAHLNKMAILISLKQSREVISEANTILNLESDNPVVNINANLMKGNEYMKLGKVDSANMAYNNVKELVLDEMKTDDNLNYQITLFKILTIQRGKSGAQYYFTHILDSSKRSNYVKTFIDTFNYRNYLNHY